MKKIVLILSSFILCLPLLAQEFTKQLGVAKTAYAAGKLDDSRFAMQQMLQELDIITGKEILKILPAVMQDKKANAKKDNVSGASGFIGVIIHKEYGTADSSSISIEIIGNSPLVGAVNAILSMGLLANAGGNQKVVKINGYKALLQKQNGSNGHDNYELQLPLNSSLITLKAPGYTQDQIITMANTLPITEIAKMLQ